MNSSFAKKLALLRAEKGLTQRDLAAAAGIAWSMISKYESGKSQPRLKVLLRLAEALDVPVEQLKENEEADDVELMFEVTFEKLGPVRCSLHFTRGQHKKLAEEYSSLGQNEKNKLLSNYMLEAMVGAAQIEGSPLQLNHSEDEITKVSARFFAPKEYIDEIRGTPVYDLFGGNSKAKNE